MIVAPRAAEWVAIVIGNCKIIIAEQLVPCFATLGRSPGSSPGYRYSARPWSLWLAGDYFDEFC